MDFAIPVDHSEIEKIDVGDGDAKFSWKSGKFVKSEEESRSSRL